MNREQQFAVVGAGLVGAVLAYGLAELGYKVLVCDRQQIDQPIDLSRFERPISVNWYTRSLLHELNLWPALKEAAVPIKRVQVSVANSFGSHEFRASTTPALGYILSFSALQQLLWKKIAAHANIELISWKKMIAFRHDDKGVNIEYERHDASTAMIDVAACCAVDGTRSRIRDEFLNIKSDDGATLCCLAADVMANDLKVAAYQRMSQKGTLALIPTLVAQQFRLMWSMPSTLADKLKKCTADELLLQANPLLGRKLGCLHSCSRHVFLDLPWKIAQQSQAGNVVLMGNAAHTIYPAAAQGFNLGLQDVSILLSLLAGENTTEIAAVFSDYLKQALPLKRKRIQFVKLQHEMNQRRLTQSLMAKALGAMDMVRPISNKVASTYMGADVDGKYLDNLRLALAKLKVKQHV